MKYAELKQISKLYFGYEEIARVLDINSESARVSASRYVKQGLLVRLKRNLYVLKDRWESRTRDDSFVLANVLQVPSYVSLMTALEYYEISTQIQREFIESIALKRTKEYEIENTNFSYTKINALLYFGFTRERGLFIAPPEKALLDAFYLTSLKRYRFDTSSIDPDKIDSRRLKRAAKTYPKKTQELLKKHGYLTDS